MTLAYWCVLIAAVLPYAATLTAKIGGRMPLGANAYPREWQEQLRDGWQKRAHWAQLNSYESFPVFAAGVIIAHQTHVAQARLDLLAVLFIVSRVAYFFAYVANLATLRSLIWTAGMICILLMFVAGA